MNNITFLCFSVIFLFSVLTQGNLLQGKKRDVQSRSHGRSKSKDEGKIVGGSTTTIQQHPYQVYLLLKKGNDYYQCGGSIISARYILTAAHCVKGISTAYVRAGSTNSNSGGTMYSTTRLVAHPLYNSHTSDYDVAFIDLQRNINLDGRTTKAIGLPSSGASVQPGNNVVVSGWGTTSENGETSTNLMAVTVPTISNADCRKSYSTVTSRMFCAGIPQGGKDSCQGDSGGPAVNSTSGVQLGVVSFGIGCARAGYPGVYANLSNSAIRRWIQINTGV